MELKAAGPPTIAAGWKVWEGTDQKVSIGAPNNWSDKQVVYTNPMGGDAPPIDPHNMPQEMKDMLGGIPEQMAADEKAEQEAQAKKDAEEGTILRLFDNSTRPIPAEVPTGLVITERGSSGQLDVDAKDYVTGQFRLDDVKSNERVELAQGPAQRVVVEFTDIKGDVIKRIVYIVSHKGKSYRVVFRQTNSAGEIETTSKAMIETFRVKI